MEIVNAINNNKYCRSDGGLVGRGYYMFVNITHLCRIPKLGKQDVEANLLLVV